MATAEQRLGGRGILAAAVTLVAGWLWVSAAWAAEPTGPLDPQASLARIQLEPGLRIELVACEPEVIDPIAIRFDEDGRLWVVEMRDYPHGPPEGQPPLSKIRMLSDSDGDGRFETSQVFAEGLLFPTGVQPWKGGLIVTLAGEVIYLKDTDGDGRADQRETWYRGFVAENPQLRANHPRFGPDNRIYISNGLRGGEVIDARLKDAQPLSISGRDFCFNPHTGATEAVTGNGQFGNTFDDLGNRFVCNNRQPLDQVVLDNRYLARNPFLAVPSAVSPVAASGELSRVFPLTPAWTTSSLHAGQFTAACGVEIYRGDALPKEFYGNAFICEPTGSLVHREVLTPKGATFTSQARPADREFLASTDAWFRPVNLEVGPDGALYLVDMYRAVIEHPQYMPSELQTRPDLRLGDDRGRIYRIVAQGWKAPGAGPRLSQAKTEELVTHLGHANAWWRETAARLLCERQDPTVRALLAQAIQHDKRPISQLAALNALAGQGTSPSEALTAEVLLAALADSDAGVRETSVPWAEHLLTNGDVLKRVIALAGDPEPRVRFRAALALGGVSSPEVAEPLAAIARQDAGDPWTVRAVLTADPQHIALVLAVLLRSPEVVAAELDSPHYQLVQHLATLVGARRDADEIGTLLDTACQGESIVPIQAASLLGIAQGLERRGTPLVEFAASLPQAKPRAQKLAQRFAQWVAVATDPNETEPRRLAGLELLRHARHSESTEALGKLVAEDPSQAVRVGAAAAVAYTIDGAAISRWLESYPMQTPTVRRAILDALCLQPGSALSLLAAVQQNRISRAELDAPRENRLRGHADSAVAELAKKLLTTEPPAERKKVLAEYQSALELAPDVAAGKQLFRKHCAVCHRIGDLGVDVAPDISDSRVKTQAQLLTDILNPNQAIDNNYLSYTLALSDGNVLTGILSAETATSVTLRQQENKTLTLLRSDIESIRSSGVSLMPEGFEKQLDQQQMADLIGFIKNWRYTGQAVPATIAPGAR